ncbi:MAG: NYN domain-containing protein [Chloroflexi bacterium]|nr:NYN domain-containing protein [Chloroflexota bacterium]
MTAQIAVFIDFENIAIWARQEFFDFELTPLIEYLQSRGSLVIKRAYGDWTAFRNYRDDLIAHTIDLTQLFSVRESKNRADIRIALDALETAITHPQIDTFVIVSGDSDFSMLASRLREYGRYTLGIGPRKITHMLLVKSCDEFVYLETVLGAMPDEPRGASAERDEARRLLERAIQAHVQRGDLPVLASRLKQTILSFSPAFSETAIGYTQFKSWLEDNHDFVQVFFRDLHLYVAPRDFRVPERIEPGESSPAALPATPLPPPSPLENYQRAIVQAGLPLADFAERRAVLQDIYELVSERPGALTAEQMLDVLRDRYELRGLSRGKPLLFQIWQLAFRQHAFDFGSMTASAHVPLSIASGLTSLDEFVRQAESTFIAAALAAGLPIDNAELAGMLLNDRAQTDYVQALVDSLSARGALRSEAERRRQSLRDLLDYPPLAPLMRDLAQPALEARRNGISADAYARRAMVERSQDFRAASQDFLIACRLQWDAVERGDPGATLDDLRWYLASYASTKAGELSQVHRDYAGARPYYLAYFSLVREDDPILWGKMRGLMVPMLSYYWVNLAREIDLHISPASTPADVAATAAGHPNVDLRQRWLEATRALAAVNPNVLRRIAEQIRAEHPESAEHAAIADRIAGLLSGQ